MEREVCKCLCKAVKKPNDKKMKGEIDSISNGLGVSLKAKKIWAASNGRKGFTAIAVKFNPVPGGESVLVIVFRSTNGLTEWLEYLVQSYNVPRDGDTKDGTLRVFKVWKRTLDEIWSKPLFPEISGSNTLRRMIWRQLNKGGRVWLTGHSKGGAVATTAASRLVLGDSAQHDLLHVPARVRRPRDSSRELSSALKRLSVFTFNAPKALNGPLAEEYKMKTEAIGTLHLRFETEGDVVVNLPPPRLQLEHVGLPIPKARHVDKATARNNRKVRVVKNVAGLVVSGGTLAIWALCWAGLLVGGGMFTAWCVWGFVVIAVGFGVRKFAELKEETQLLHALSESILCMADEEGQPLRGNCSYLRLLLVEYQERLGLLNGSNTTSTDDDHWSMSPEEVEKLFLQRTIWVNSLTEEDMSKANEFLGGVYVRQD